MKGVNLALLDGLDLCECLTSGDHANLKEAISASELVYANSSQLLGKPVIRRDELCFHRKITSFTRQKQ